MKRSQLNELNRVELDAMQNLRFQKALQQIEDPKQISLIRREIAQIKTVLREMDLGIRTQKDGDK